jgi:hypothetical protein
MAMGFRPGAAVLASLLALSARVSGGEVTSWKPAGVSSPQFESHPAFDPITGDFYFVRSSPAFEGWRILVSRCGAAGWSKPEPPAFAGGGVEADPWFTPDGRSLYFISTRATKSGMSKDLDIWRVDRAGKDGWAEPMRLPEPINSPAAEWFPRLSPDGWLYFGSGRPGGLGETDIWRARAGPDGVFTVENLGKAVNTEGNEYEPLPSPDGSRLILMTDAGVFESRRAEDGSWSPRKKLGRDVNVNGTEIGPLFSPSGKTLLFARATAGPDSGEFFVSRESTETWPPDCAPKTAPP